VRLYIPILVLFVLAAGFAAFSLLGLFSALVPTFLVGVLHDTSHAVAGAVVFLAFAVAASLYDILTFRANGTDLRVFAKGMRQPWQFAFKPGSNSPFVTDLGQDSGAKNPPDFVLHVHAGDNYGFPTCNHTVAANCQGFTKPFRSFAPHTDLMGIAVHRGTLYLTSFLGKGAKGPGGEVFTLGDIVEAHRHLEKGRHAGKIVVTV